MRLIFDKSSVPTTCIGGEQFARYTFVTACTPDELGSRPVAGQVYRNEVVFGLVAHGIALADSRFRNCNEECNAGRLRVRTG